VWRRSPRPLQSAPDIRLVIACATREPPSAAVRALHVLIPEAVAMDTIAPRGARELAERLVESAAL